MTLAKRPVCGDIVARCTVKSLYPVEFRFFHGYCRSYARAARSLRAGQEVMAIPAAVALPPQPVQTTVVLVVAVEILGSVAT